MPLKEVISTQRKHPALLKKNEYDVVMTHPFLLGDTLYTRASLTYVDTDNQAVELYSMSSKLPLEKSRKMESVNTCLH